MARKWYKGDNHLHTSNSFDGFLTKGQLVDECKKAGLDFMIITDHNVNSVNQSYFDGDMLVIQGQELTDELGHVNVWGKKVPFEPPYALNCAEDYDKIISACKEDGAIISLNHPFCSNCGFKLDMEAYPFDCVEVWNTIQHSDNMKNRDWWVSQLLKGNKIGAVGGSDFHRNQFGIPLLAMPTTIVHAESKSEKDILDALVQGRSVITNSPKSSMIYMTYGDANIGDTVKLNPDKKLQIKITNIKKGHTLKVFNNDKLIYENKASKKSALFMAEVDVKETGFVRAEITYRFNPIIEKIYAFAENTFLSKQGVKDTVSYTLPDFLWAFTNPIWLE